MHRDFIKEKIRLEQHKFEIVYIKNLWALIISLGGSLLVLLQLFFGADASVINRKILGVLAGMVSSGLVVGILRYLYGKETYMKTLDELMRELENAYN